MNKNNQPCIVYIITKLELGGAQKVCLSLFNHFAPNSFLLSANNGELYNSIKDNPNYIPLPTMQRQVSIFTVFLEILTFFNIFLHLRSLKKKYPNIIVHTHSSKAGILGRLAAYCAGIRKIIHTVHGFGITPSQSWLTQKIFWLSEQIATLCSDKIICVSHKDLLFGNNIFIGFKNKATLIRAAVSPLQFQQSFNLLKGKSSTVSQNIILGSIACFKPQKNLFDLFKAFFLLTKLLPPNIIVHLNIIGDGELRPAIEKQIALYKLEEKILLLGWQENVASIIPNWDIFCLTSLWEGLPCSIIEARLNKIPCVCYDTGGITEVIQHNVNGIIVKSKTPAEMAISLNNLILNSRLLTSMQQFKDDLGSFFATQMIAEHRRIYSEFGI